jgi:predicted RNA-binding Zn ribbon-like protein
MLFVKAHHRRQWCHESCGHRARQATYYRRTRRTRLAGVGQVDG